MRRWLAIAGLIVLPQIGCYFFFLLLLTLPLADTPRATNAYVLYAFVIFVCVILSISCFRDLRRAAAAETE